MRRARETAGISWYTSFCSRYGIRADVMEAAWGDMVAYFNPDTPRAEANALAAMLQNIADALATLPPGAVVPDIAALIARHGADLGVSPEIRSTQAAVRKLIKESDLLTHIPAVSEQYIRRLPNGTATPTPATNGGND